jgi:hypothetical protein
MAPRCDFTRGNVSVPGAERGRGEAAETRAERHRYYVNRERRARRRARRADEYRDEALAVQ